MKLLLQVGPFSIYFFGLMIAVGIFAAYILIQQEAKRKGHNSDKVLNIGIGALMGGIIGARLTYILAYAPGYYLNNPLTIFSIHHGGLSIHGGIAGGLLIGWLLARHYRLSFWMLADLFAPPLILAQAIGRVGCDVFGKPMATGMFWGINFQGNLVHPVQMYEFLLNLGLFWWLWQRRKAEKIQGQIFFYYALGYLLIRGLIEFFRTNPVLFGFLSVSHFMTLIGLAVVLAAMSIIRRPHYPGFQKQNFSMMTFITVCAIGAAGIFLYYSIH